jgi:HD superfamily phosphohydrolase
VAERMYRDPVHNIISLSESDPVDRLLIDLVDSPEFQRLRRIRQLGLALYTYQGAEHSRFTHSLGVMHVMTRALGRLRRDVDVSEEARCAGRAAALLHDVGHGPFSHVIEKVLGLRHEQRTLDILLDPRTRIHEVLTGYDPELPARVASVYDYSFKPAFVCQLVSSQLDVDRCDYLLRDSLMTGAKYGNYDLEWILSHLRVDPAGERLFVEREGLYAVEEYLQARYYMFRQVYFHRTLRSAEAVLISALRRAVDLHAEGRLRFVIPGSVFERVLRREKLDVPEYLQLDDHDLIFHIKQWTTEPDAVLAPTSSRPSRARRSRPRASTPRSTSWPTARPTFPTTGTTRRTRPWRRRTSTWNRIRPCARSARSARSHTSSAACAAIASAASVSRTKWRTTCARSLARSRVRRDGWRARVGVGPRPLSVVRGPWSVVRCPLFT